MKDGKNVIIAALLVAVLVMSVGYSAFATKLEVNGNAEITGEWDVEITNIVASAVEGDAKPGTPTFTNTTAQFDTDLLKPGDSVTYTITIANKGTIDATLSDFQFLPEEDGPHVSEGGDHAIVYENTQPAQELKASSTTKFTIKVTYKDGIEEEPTVKERTVRAIVEYSQKS